MNNPLISVIVPVFNSEKTIKRCLHSILKQSYSNFEIIIVDDGSTDSSKILCKEIQNNDSRVHLLSQTNHGVSSARNNGLLHSKGDFVCFVDSDDYVHKDYLSLLLKSSDEGELSVCGIYCVTKLRIFKNRIKKQKMPSSTFESVRRLKLVELLNAPVNKLYNKSLINFSFDENLKIGEDLIFNLRYLNNISTIKTIKKCLYYYDRRRESLTRSFRENALEEQAKLWMLASSICSNAFRDYDGDFFKCVYFSEVDAILIDLPYTGNDAIDEEIIKQWLSGDRFKESLVYFEQDDERYYNFRTMSQWILRNKRIKEKTIRNRLKRLILSFVAKKQGTR